jgi:cyclopropane-fatty-acyl-phospholipid synthase
MSAVINKAVGWTELGLVPDSVVRAGIRRLLESKLREIQADDLEHAANELNHFVAMMNQSPIALVPELANEQHYEVPAEFFIEVMGDHLKYSCGYWPSDVDTLTASEAAALRLAVQRAGIENGMQVLDLGCGWGSLSLWIAEQFPQCSVTSVSNSSSQREFILRRAEQMKLQNIEVIVQDMNDFVTEDRFDRVVSVEMFEPWCRSKCSSTCVTTVSCFIRFPGGLHQAVDSSCTFFAIVRRRMNLSTKDRATG